MIPSENGLPGRRILQAGQLAVKERRTFFRQTINHPPAAAFAQNHAVPPQVGQVARHLDLGFAQDFLQMTDAERTPQQKMDDAQPRLLTEAFVDAQEIHTNNIYAQTYMFFKRAIHQAEPDAKNKRPAAPSMVRLRSSFRFFENTVGKKKTDHMVASWEVFEHHGTSHHHGP